VESNTTRSSQCGTLRALRGDRESNTTRSSQCGTLRALRGDRESNTTRSSQCGTLRALRGDRESNTTRSSQCGTLRALRGDRETAHHSRRAHGGHDERRVGALAAPRGAVEQYYLSRQAEIALSQTVLVLEVLRVAYHRFVPSVPGEDRPCYLLLPSGRGDYQQELSPALVKGLAHTDGAHLHHGCRCRRRHHTAGDNAQQCGPSGGGGGGGRGRGGGGIRYV
jgi:hypothetical protein